MFKFPVLTQDQILELQKPIDEGDYHVRIENAISTISQNSGNPQIKLSLTILGPNGKQPKCFDYLVALEEMAWKTRHLLESIGRPELYDTGEFSESVLIGTKPYAKIKLVKSEDGQKLYPKVIDYLIPPEAVAKVEEENVLDNLDDDIPF
jgi:hypothetical protein